MGKVFSLAIKPIKNFNIESRARKIISEEKPVPAPKYKVDILELERIQRDHPEIIDQHTRKDEMLEKRLKKVFVNSYDPPDLHIPPANPNRPLPTIKTAPGDFEYGFYEPTEVPMGKVTLQNVLQFINNHQADPKNYTSTKIACEYNLPEKTIKNILKYCRIFEMYFPKNNKKSKTNFFGPSMPRKEIVTRNPKILPQKTCKEET